MPRPVITSLLTIAFGFLLVLTVAVPANATAPVLEVNGNRIVDRSSGSEFVPHGVNWPSFEYACQQGWGYSNLGAGPGTARAMLDWNINTVRIPLNQDCWLGEDGLPASSVLSPAGYRLAVESFVGDLSAAGIAVILDLHWSAPPGYVADGLRPMADSGSDDFWVSVADQFKGNPGVIFDLFNEPHSRWDPNRPKFPAGSGTGDWDFRLSWEVWTNGGGHATNHADTEYPFTRPKFTTLGMNHLVDVVRSTGASQPILLGGLDYANDLSQWFTYAPDDDQLIAGFHNYPGQRCSTVRCWNQEIATLAGKVPVITGEFGQNDCRTDHLETYMAWADRFHIGYLAWAWWDLDDLPGNAPGCSNYALIEDLAGTPTPQYGAAFRTHLTDLPSHPPPVKAYPKSDPGLTITNARFGRGVLRSEVRLVPEATRALQVTVQVFRKTKRGRFTRIFRSHLRSTGGLARLKRRIPRKWTPVRLTVSYPGDDKLMPDSTTRRPKAIRERKR